MSSRPRFACACLVLITTMLLTACAPQSARDTSPDTADAARALSAEGRHGDAASIWLALAEAQPGQSLNYRLNAADAWLAAARPSAARAALEPLSGLAGSERVRVDMRLAQAALEEGLLQRAVALMTVNNDHIPDAERLAFLALRARVSEANGDLLAAARDHHRRAQRQIGLEREQARGELYRVLSALPVSQLQRLSSAYANDEAFGPWVELAEAVKRGLLSGDDLDQVVQRFQQRHPDHPAAGQLSRSLVAQTRERFRRPDKVAVLLPRSGRFNAAANAIRDGFLNAYYQRQSERPEIRFYDSGDRPGVALAAYRQAVEEGADLVVGPLDRPAVAQLQALPERGIPVLALNDPQAVDSASDVEVIPEFELRAPGPDSPPLLTPGGALFVRMALSPEAEAAQAAQLARQMGKRRALVLAADDSWGERMLLAFDATFSQLGGVVADTRFFEADETNHDAPVQAILDLQRSQRRYQRIRQLVGEPLSFDPTIRQDADVIFLAARAENARLLVPLLRFHRGGELPVLATAAVHDLSRDTPDDDLEGVMFCDAPWVLDGSHRRLPEAFASGGPSSRLFALGMDSYRLLPYLEWLASHPGERFPGATGDLSVSEDGRIERDLACAHFRNGRARLLAVQEQLGMN